MWLLWVNEQSTLHSGRLTLNQSVNAAARLILSPSGSKFDVRWCVCCYVLPNWFIGPSPDSVSVVIHGPISAFFVFHSQLFLYSLLIESKMIYSMRQSCGLNFHPPLYTVSFGITLLPWMFRCACFSVSSMLLKLEVWQGFWRADWWHFSF